jgi:hypothetical protein
MAGRWPNGESNDFYYDEENLDQEDDASPYDREDPSEFMYEYEPDDDDADEGPDFYDEPDYSE